LPSFAGTIVEEPYDDGDDDAAGGGLNESIYAKNALQRGPIRTEFSSRDKDDKDDKDRIIAIA